jgi:diguanylate cyclase (GGDEF)-like protein
MGQDVSKGRNWYLGVTGTLTVAHPLLPLEVRSVTYLVVSACTVVPLTALARRSEWAQARMWWILAAAMAVLTVGNAVTTIGGTAMRLPAELLLTVGHAGLLGAAVSLVLLRGRNDIGGLLDVSVTAIGLGGLVWTALVFPRLRSLDTPQGEQATLLMSMLILLGVLGALARVWRMAETRLPALVMLLGALLLALVGNVLLTVSSGTMTTGRPGWTEMFFLLAYILVGLAPLDASVPELQRAGPAPVDRLSAGRLAFLGATLAANPLVAGLRQVLDLHADGLLLAVGTVLIVPLVMVRIGRLATERRSAEEALRHQATHDPLTGLPNRAELITRLQAALDRERAAGQPAVVLLFCDLNGFKGVNDRLGHTSGDQLLTGIGARIRAGLRAHETIARYGGDEFLVLCEEPDQAQAARRLTGYVESALAEPFALAGTQVRASCSVGAVLSDGRTGADELITRADQAMYRAKQRQHAAA